MNKATRVILLSALGIAIPIVSYLCYQYFRPPESVADMPAGIAEGAVAIGRAYMTDEMEADQKYLGKTVDISGRITDIQIQENGGKTIYFAGDDNTAPVAVLLAGSTSENDFPAKGDSVLVRGICTGYLMDVTFNRGIVLKNFN